jgi:hypothetical protein
MPGKKADAEAFASRWANKGNENQDTQRFWIDFYQNVLGVEDAVSRLEFEKPVSTDASTHDGYIDVFIPSAKTLVEQKSLGIDLAKEETRQGRKVTPAKQGNAYAQGMPLSQQPRYIIACNFAEFWVFDRERDSLCREPLFKLPLAELPKNLAAIQFLKGGAEAPATISRAVSVEAGKIMSKLHDQVAEAFDDPDTPENHHALSVLMTRLMFLMFCEDSGLVAPNAFRDYVSHFQAGDLRRGLKDLFVWLDTKDEDRDKYAEPWLKKLPYMNGGLFREKTEIPPLSENFRYTLIVEGCQEFDWSGVSPTVFGSIFEGALSHDHRRANGQHFTNPENIHKVIDPLFLDGLKAEFDEACAKPVAGGARTRALKDLHKKIGSISILDPAAGSGNFLTESYLCLRRLENRILFELQGDQASFSFEDSGDRDVLVNLKNFHGIELEDFACCVARTALWIAEKQADADTAKVTQRVYQELPLTDYEGIVNANALRIDWNDVVPADEVSYVLGNPPFIGHQWRNEDQQSDMELIFKGVRGAGKLDYVCCWFEKAAAFIKGERARCAFVATNSVCQGESVGILWRRLAEEGIEIDFAWRSFIWDSQSNDEAHVHVVIVGFGGRSSLAKVIYGEKGTVSAEHINGYLLPAPDVFIENRGKPINCGAPEMTKGSQPTDGGNLILTDDERKSLIEVHPNLEEVIRPFVGGREFLNGGSRWCLWFNGADMSRYVYPEIRARLKAVSAARGKSPTKSVREAAATPMLFTQIRQPVNSYIALPVVSSGRRRYLPVGYESPATIASDQLRFIPSNSLYIFGLLSSRVHVYWIRAVAGRLKSDYRYSPSVYNSFVFPDADENMKDAIERAAQGILAARALSPDSSLAKMYDPDNEVFYSRLMTAHANLDMAVESAYGIDYGDDEDKVVAHLFNLYAEKVGE